MGGSRACKRVSVGHHQLNNCLCARTHQVVVVAPCVALALRPTMGEWYFLR